MSIMGVMLGVCVLVIVQSVMNGFGEGIRQRLTETQGDIRIRSNEVIYDWEAVLDTVLEQDAVVGASPFTEGRDHASASESPTISFCAWH
jgi:lipoprotein-releasing system permease protein